jgi:hypothetical protein
MAQDTLRINMELLNYSVDRCLAMQILQPKQQVPASTAGAKRDFSTGNAIELD